MWIYGTSLLREILEETARGGVAKNYLPVLVRYGGGRVHQRSLEKLLAPLPGWLLEQVHIKPLVFGRRLRRFGLLLDLFAGCGEAAVVHGTSNSIPLLGPGVKVLTLHDLLQGYGRSKLGLYQSLRGLFHRAAIFFMSRRANAIITDISLVKEELQERLAVGHKTFVVLPGLERQFVQSKNLRFRPRSRNTLLAFSARDSRKRLDLVLAGLNFLRRAGREVYLVVVASSARAAAEASRAAADLGLEGVVDVRSGISTAQLIELYQSVAALVFPSDAEGFGYPVYEALSQGACVVCKKGLVVDAIWRTAKDLLLLWDDTESRSLYSLMEAAGSIDLADERRIDIAETVREQLDFRRAVGEVMSIYENLVGRHEA
jgi:glycosyltransferase involved in cell wall biosynthesis